MEADQVQVNPARNLLGLTLKDGWKVVELIRKSAQSTGAFFSVGYKVQRDSEEAYLKALDFSGAFQSTDPARELEAMTSAYNFERDLLAKCKERRMRNVVMPIADGCVDVPGLTIYNKVFYIILELAEGDVRNVIATMQSFDLAWCLRSLHNIAVGLSQLHWAGIAHQDLKPSNVLVFKMMTSKVSDLGRASDITTPFVTDTRKIPGDINYAPPESFYGYRSRSDFDFRFALDMYHFGSLIFFYFAGLSATQAIKAKFVQLVGEGFLQSDFESDLPYFQKAFGMALEDLGLDIGKICGTHAHDILEMATELCDPDPRKRGHPRNILSRHDQYSLQRYISRLDLLARKVELQVE